MDYFLNKNTRKVTSTDNANPFNTKYFYLFLFLIKKIATRRKVFLKKKKKKEKKKEPIREGDSKNDVRKGRPNQAVSFLLHIQHIQQGMRWILQQP